METKVRFRKIGGGSFRLGDRIIKPNEVFSANPDEIPKLFMKFLVQIDGDPVIPKLVRTKKKFDVKPTEDVPVEKDLLTQDMEKATLFGKPIPLPEAEQDVHVVQFMGGGWYDIVNLTTGKQINEKKLRKAVAEKLVAELNS